MNVPFKAFATPGVYAFDPRQIRDIAPSVIDGGGRLKVMPASFYAETLAEERAYLGYRKGVYALPTIELIEWVRAYIGDRTAIEIGAGNGVIAEALGIPATDNKMQANAAIQTIYATTGQQTVMYGPDVEMIDANAAVRQHKPQVVVAAWVTHKYEATNPAAGGNMFGVDELDLLAHCDEYVFIGNAQVHATKPLWSVPPDIYETPSWLYSRALNGTPNFIAVWKRKQPNEQSQDGEGK